MVVNTYTFVGKSANCDLTSSWAPLKSVAVQRLYTIQRRRLISAIQIPEWQSSQVSHIKSTSLINRQPQNFRKYLGLGQHISLIIAQSRHAPMRYG